MNFSNLITWRMVFKLSATFVFMILFSCKKKESAAGINSIDPNEILNSIMIDTFSIKTFTIIEDSIQTNSPISALLGSYNDPEFGTFKAGFFTQLRLPAVNPLFGDLSTIVIDSFVLGLQYSANYGDLSAQKFEVFQLTDSLNLAAKYYSFSNKSHSTTNLIDPTKANLTPNPTSKIVIETTEVNAQLRLYLDTNLARTFLNESVSSPSTYSSNENFLNYFKGLYVGVDNGYQPSGTGGVFSFNLYDPLSKLTIYYTQSGTKKTYDFLINPSCANFTKTEINNSGTSIDNAFENSATAAVKFYCQAAKSRAIVKLPGIKNLSKKSIIHEAKLVLPVEFQITSNYTPSAEISISTKLEKAKGFFNVATGIYNEVTKQYTIDLKPYIQAIISEQRYPVTTASGTYNALIEDVELYITPKLFNTSAERIIFNGSNTSNTNKPKLMLKYTEF